MSLIVDALVNLWRLVRNARARLLGRPPDYVWIEVSGPLAEFETPVGFLRRRLSPGPSPPTLERLRARLDRYLRRRSSARRRAAHQEPRCRMGRHRGVACARSWRSGHAAAGSWPTWRDPVDTRSYYLACAADEILATPLADLNVTGYPRQGGFPQRRPGQPRPRGRGRRRLALQVSGRAVRQRRLLPRVPRAGRTAPRQPLRGGGGCDLRWQRPLLPKRSAPR